MVPSPPTTLLYIEKTNSDEVGRRATRIFPSPPQLVRTLSAMVEHIPLPGLFEWRINI